MKKCNKCNGVFQDKYVMCPNCNIPLLETIDNDINIKTTPVGTTKEEFQNRIENKSKSINNLICPRCGSDQIQLMKRGWKWTTGFIGMSKNERVCLNCLHRW